MLDAVRVTIIGGTKRKFATRDRRGATVDRYDVRWRVQLHNGLQRDFRQKFERAVDAEQFIGLLRAVGVPGSPWRLDDAGRPVDGTTQPPDRKRVKAADVVTVWDGLLQYRSATWRGASANGRKIAVYALRAMARLTEPRSRAIPPATLAYLDKIAFRSEHEPSDHELRKRIVEHASVRFSGDQLLEGRKWLERHSLPLGDLDRTIIRRLVAELGDGRAPATEGRRWVQVRSILNWWRHEGLITADLTTRIGHIRGTVIQPLADDDPIPTEAEMWTMGWALCLVGRSRYAALPLVMGAAGLRIGECFALRRRDCTDEPGGGMWLSVRGSYSKPGREWTDSGKADERRGTKANGPDGDLRGRRTYLPPAEAAVLCTHLEHFTATSAESLVFTTEQGRPVDLAHLQERAWQRARQLAFPPPHRLQNVGRHAFRHLAATRWLRAGVPLKTAARWGGWKDIATMLRWYESRLPGDDEIAAHRVRSTD